MEPFLAPQRQVSEDKIMGYHVVFTLMLLRMPDSVLSEPQSNSDRVRYENGADCLGLGLTSEMIEIPGKANSVIDDVEESKTLYGSLKIGYSRV